jgi:enoyl-CoA hydratase/carnithine racemase
MLESAVEYDLTEQIGIIRLNRPEAGNTVNETVMQRLESILQEVESDSGLRALILTGAGDKTFCAGGDFRYFATLDARHKGLEMSVRMQKILNRLWAGRLPVIAAINGKALGGGCEVLTACHFRVAAPTATFAFVQAANAITTGWGGALRLFHLVGRSQALRLLLTAEPIDASEAMRIGFVNTVASSDQVMNVALDLAGSISRNSRDSVRGFLEIAEMLYAGDVDRAIKRETEIFADRWVSDEFRRVVKGFHDTRSGRQE